ncbi:MAG: DUF924 domain-containing protein [Alphaproteobacteria bacterium]|nr:DUF924 domain-containing protein [Alphaproteobacteria bacterium]
MLFPSSVLHFWFSELGPKDWFAVNPAVDDRVRARFLDLHRAMRQSPPDAAALDAAGHLAAVIVFDQFPRNLFRGTAEAFATDPLALALSDDAIARGLDAGLSVHERQFLYMPHMHSEDPAVQARSVALFDSLGFPEALLAALDHKQTIDRFGRFPYRNAALGRVSTPDEEAFLKVRPSP